MIKTILTIFISGLMGLLLLSFVLPDQAALLTHGLAERFNIQNVLPSIISKEEPTIEDDTKPQDGIDTSSAPSTAGKPDTDTRTLTIEHIIDETNKQRIANGLVPLKTNALLNASAKLKTDDMIKRQYFEHISPSGEGVSDLGAKVGYDYILMGENLALGNFGSSQELLTAWMNSPGHRANILNTGYQEIGVYAARGTYEGRTVWFAVQHFGTARGACPLINDKLKATIDTTNTRLKAQEKDIAAKRAALESEDHPRGSEYDRMVAEFNALVAKYNGDLATSQKNIATYNAQVKAFNACLSVYQK